jgi:FkbM family methyltransferase
MPSQISQLPRKKPSFVRRFVTGSYTFVFGRPSCQKVNERLLHLTMRGCGYDAGPNPARTGEKHFIRLVAKTGPTVCIDIGANAGDYSALLLENTAAHVIAFEPLPQTFERLRPLKNAYQSRFTTENLGVGDCDGVLTLHHGEDSTLASFSPEVSQIGYVGATNIETTEVPVVTLDSYFASLPGDFPEIDLIKIDTEGFEIEVLRGAERTIAERRPKFVQIEFNLHQLLRGQSILTFAEFLPGYDVYQILPFGTTLIRRDPNSPEANIYRYSNFVFIRSDITLTKLLQRRGFFGRG